MRTTRRFTGLKPMALLAGALLLAVAQAQAREVVWSVGVGSPGVQVGATNAPPTWHQPQLVVLPYPIYLLQPPVRVVGQPYGFVAPARHQLQPAWQPVPFYGRGWVRHHRRHGHHDFDHRGGGLDHDRGAHR